MINETYRRFAVQLKSHVDACQPRHPQGKGKAERHARDLRETVNPKAEPFESLEHLQAVTDARLEDRARRLRCPLTGTPVAEAWEQERRLLTPLPETLPEPFDVVVRRPVDVDCTVSSRYLRKNLVHGARAFLPSLAASETSIGRWLRLCCAKPAGFPFAAEGVRQRA